MTFIADGIYAAITLTGGYVDISCQHGSLIIKHFQNGENQHDLLLIADSVAYSIKVWPHSS